MKILQNLSGQLRAALCSLTALLAFAPIAEAARGRPVLNASRTTFVADNGRLIRGPYESTEWTDAAPYAEVQKIKSLGFNAVHLYAESFNLTYPASGGTPPGYAMAKIDQMVATTRDLGLYLIITIGNGAYNGNHNYQWAVDFWKLYAPRYANETHVIYEIHNEPVAWGPSYLTATTPSGALQMEIDAYKAIRAAAPDTPVLLFTYAVLAGTGGGNAALNDIRAFNQAVFGTQNATWTNEAVGFHGYGGWKNTTDAVSTVLAAGYPCMMTEFIAHDWSGPDAQDIELTSELERLGVSWLTFLTIPPYGVSPDVTDDHYFKTRIDKAGLAWTPDFGTWPAWRRPFGNGNQPRRVPGPNTTTGLIQGTLRVQAEDYDEGGQNVAYYDSATGNSGGAYRTSDAVDIQATTDTGGGHNVGWTSNGEWLEYTIWPDAGGLHTLNLRVSAYAATSLRVLVNGVDKTGVWNIASTGGTQNWTTLSKTVDLDWGRQKVRIEFLGGSLNLNWFELSPTTSGTLADGNYRIVNRNSGLALDSSGANDRIIQTPFMGASSQLWNFQHLGANQYRIRSVATNRNWNSGNGPDDTVNTVGWWGIDAANQRVLLKSSDSGYLRFISAGGGFDLETDEASVAIGAGIEQSRYFATNNDHLEWAIQPASTVQFPGNLTAVVASPSQINLEWNATSGAASYTVKRSTTSGSGYATIASGVTATTYNDTTANAGTTTYYYVVTAVSSGGESLPSAEARATRVRAHVKFDEASGATSADGSGNNFAATLLNNPTWISGVLGSSINLDGVEDYATLPAGIVSGLTECTISTWAYLDEAKPYSRIFDFGSGTGTYLYFTTAYSNGRPGVNIRTGGVEYNISGSAALPLGRWTHLAVTFKPGTEPGYTACFLYVDGVITGQTNWMKLNPASLGSTTLNYIGKAQSNQPFLNGRIDDFRVFSQALTNTDVARLAAQRPRTLLAFDENTGTTATDRGAGTWNGTFVNGPTWTTGKRGTAVNLDGVDDHVTLPSGVVAGLNDYTIATWVRPDSAAAWTRVFDFGTGGSNFMTLTPRNSSTNTVRFLVRSAAGDQIINGTSALPVGVWSHVAVTLKGTTGTLYVNGVAVGSNTTMTTKPSSLGSTTINYLGRSQFSWDAYLAGAIDDFRIYNTALSPADIATLATP